MEAGGRMEQQSYAEHVCMQYRTYGQKNCRTSRSVSQSE